MTASQSGKPWTATDISKLKTLAAGNTPTELIAYRLQRTAPAVQAKASEQAVSLKPVNKSPYNRRKS